MTADLRERIAQRVRVTESGCWQWTGAIASHGYGRIGRGDYAHRLSYEVHVGPIPDGLELDHLCRNRACCNPDHLEPVTHLENVRRGLGPIVAGLYMASKTHCVNGHPYDEANTLISRDKDGRFLQRQCRVCGRERMADRRRRGLSVKPRRVRLLPTQRHVLSVLAAHAHLTANDPTAWLPYTESAVRCSLGPLCDRGLVEPSGMAGRSRTFRITDAGRDALARRLVRDEERAREAGK